MSYRSTIHCLLARSDQSYRVRIASSMRRATIVLTGCFFLLLIFQASGERPKISEDRELKEYDLTGWDCLNHPEGTGRTPDAIERNRMKNRPAAELAGAQLMQLDTTTFLKHFAEFDAQTKGKHRSDLSPTQRAELDRLEKEVVSVTGYLVLAYAGPPETTNCANTDLHDWHLELFAQPADHPPRAGDPTPIICEISPRTENAIYHSGIRLQALATFLRAPDLSYESTGHPARKIRVTGTLMWDDEHNGKADVGSTVEAASPNQFHHPWRATAWEIHPIAKIEALEPDTPPTKVARHSGRGGFICSTTSARQIALRSIFYFQSR